jgi:hypothetical protein
MPAYQLKQMVPGPYLSRTAHEQQYATGGMALSCQALIYRLAAYFMLTMLDDPAMLAMAFC